MKRTRQNRLYRYDLNFNEIKILKEKLYLISFIKTAGYYCEKLVGRFFAPIHFYSKLS